MSEIVNNHLPIPLEDGWKDLADEDLVALRARYRARASHRSATSHEERDAILARDLDVEAARITGELSRRAA